MKIITRKQLLDLVYNRLNGSVPKIVLDDVLVIIMEKFIEDLSNDREFSIHNFGTFTTRTVDKCFIPDLNSGVSNVVKPFKRIVFKPHHNLVEKIKNKRNFFKKGEL